MILGRQRTVDMEGVVRLLPSDCLRQEKRESAIDGQSLPMVDIATLPVHPVFQKGLTCINATTAAAVGKSTRYVCRKTFLSQEELDTWGRSFASTCSTQAFASL